ncbi:hypothetical protein Adt_33486 [Abeliophyllum distichum]|uniref:Uncharacterized protein n=1 Tax=Abeliophyllum distichum TaxID=126358 RepID=A0ABD1QWD7_9LAMI
MSASSMSTYLSHFFNRSCIDSGEFFEKDILKALFRVPFIIAVTRADIWRSLMSRVALLNLAKYPYSDSSFSLTTCIRPMAVFLFLLLLIKYATKLRESSSNILVDRGARVATQSLASLLNVAEKIGTLLRLALHTASSGLQKSASDLRDLLLHRKLLSLDA